MNANQAKEDKAHGRPIITRIKATFPPERSISSGVSVGTVPGGDKKGRSERKPSKSIDPIG